MSSPIALPTPLVGAQRPRIALVPPAADHEIGEIAIEVCELAGLYLDEWQRWVLINSLGRRENLQWAASEVGEVIPRQNGKGSTLEGRELTGLFGIPEEGLIIHSAHEQATSSEHQRRLLELIESVPDFDSKVLRAPKGKGMEAIELRDGSRILFKTRTGGGGRGLTGDLVVLDEAMILPDATIGALVPTMAARSIYGNPQLWYAGSAVDQEKTEHGVALARVRERAIRGDPTLMYVEWSVPGDDPSRVTEEVRMDPNAWAQANPGLGIRISLEHVAKEARGMLGAREFAVERLGVGDWPDTSEEGDRVITSDAWRACACSDESQRIEGRRTFAVDVNPDRTWGSIAVSGRRPDGRCHVAVVEHLRGTDWIVPLCIGLKREHRGSKFAIDKRGPAASLIPELTDAKVRLIEMSTQDYGAACGTFFDGVTQGLVAYPTPQPDLDDAITAARKAPMGDAWKWSRKNSTSADISPLVAATLALWAAQHKNSRSRVVSLSAALHDEQDS